MQASMSGLGGVNALMWMCDGDGLIIMSYELRVERSLVMVKAIDGGRMMWPSSH